MHRAKVITKYFFLFGFDDLSYLDIGTCQAPVGRSPAQSVSAQAVHTAGHTIVRLIIRVVRAAPPSTGAGTGSGLEIAGKFVRLCKPKQRGRIGYAL